MPQYFFDSSAILKRYYREPGTDWVRAVYQPRAHSVLYLSEIAQVEVAASLRRTGRLNNEHPAYVNAIVNEFIGHIARGVYLMIPVASALPLALALCNRYWDVTPGPLRSLDAVQLASALLIAASIPDELIFVTADTRLAAVAAVEGLRVVNPAYPPVSSLADPTQSS